MITSQSQYAAMKIALAGYGAEGEAACQYFLKHGATDITILDESNELSRHVPSGVSVRLGKDALSGLSEFDFVSRTPPLQPYRLTEAKQVTSVTRMFFESCPAPIIAVTGTKGKGTTTSLIHDILLECGLSSHLVGNIGQPAVSILDEVQPEDVVCYEISSFQLWDLTISPQTAVVLMIVPDHLDVHKDLDEYVTAKGNIAAFQSVDDCTIYHPSNELSQLAALRGDGQKKCYLTPQGAHIRGEDIVIDEHIICSKSQVGLLGEHNLENICAAITAAWRYTQDTAGIARAVRMFKGLEHRLEFVAQKNGVQYYNDSFAASAPASLAALLAFEDHPVSIILGGKDKGNDFSALCQAIVQRKLPVHVVLIGDIRHQLARQLSQVGFEGYSVLEDVTMPEIVDHAATKLTGEGVLLLSPGSSSFDMFENYKDRGEQFRAAVKARL